MDEDAAERDRAALGLYLQGRTFREIAGEVGYPNAKAAYEAVQRALRNRVRLAGEHEAAG